MDAAAATLDTPESTATAAAASAAIFTTTSAATMSTGWNSVGAAAATLDTPASTAPRAATAVATSAQLPTERSRRWPPDTATATLSTEAKSATDRRPLHQRVLATLRNRSRGASGFHPCLPGCTLPHIQLCLLR